MSNRFDALYVCVLGLAASECKGPVVESAGSSASGAPSAASVPSSAPASEWPKSKDTSPIKVGIFDSVSSGTSASETRLKDVALMTIDAINDRGGLLGRKLQPVIVDPTSDEAAAAEKARQLLQRDPVAVTFGCWTSLCRRSVMPVFDELNGLLFYPVQYEGEDPSSYNVFYTGAAPNQQATPALEYLMSDKGGRAKRWVLLASNNDVYPTILNRTLRAFLNAKGVDNSNIIEQFIRFGSTDYQAIVANIKRFAAGQHSAVVSMLNGTSNLPFYEELTRQGLKASDLSVLAFSVSDEELRGTGNQPLFAHLAASNYFMSMDNPENKGFIRRWQAYSKDKNLPYGESPVTNDAMQATYLGITIWAQAVEQAGTTNVDAVRQAVPGQRVKAPSGLEIEMDEKNHHLRQPLFIAKVEANGQFDVEWKSTSISALPWSPYVVPGVVSDWTFPWVCGNCKLGKYTGQRPDPNVAIVEPSSGGDR